MQYYRIELRASPDTPLEEHQAKQQGRALGPQTVIYHIYANSKNDAELKAIETENKFLYRKNVRIFSLYMTERNG